MSCTFWKLSSALDACECGRPSRPLSFRSATYQHAEHLGHEGRFVLTFDLHGALYLEENAPTLLFLHGIQHHPTAYPLPRSHRGHEAHPVETVVEGLGDPRWNNAYLHDHSG